ncbi:site-specific DNA-methyltransferase [Thalassotalea castellviae]|uniref:site-specific DNA-methyltransferase (adenine-specific) n=1 Tax=Thalassotalea castellviae TaxID=3075612 RepID=A0ABU2ZX81_9GAMM|nr:site-specific DNA-methyltransferase [Thalassotalea sp. W431]MDT0602547.1 site-specific DNA-methyltransferase [Thalassotalea sp. W431]
MPILNWLNKEQAVTTAKNCSYRLLNRIPELSYGDQDTDNMIIQGDNLEALKSLLPTHAGKVKCIYIDPPYNTKSAFETYDDNLEHSKWLTTMYPRLELLWELLAEDGVILVSINDDEGHYLKVVCDEIFGRKNFISSLIWHYEGNTDNQAKIINYHEYIHLYSKSGRIENINVIDPNINKDSKLNKGEIRNTIVKNGPKNPVKSVVIPSGFPANFKDGVIKSSNVNWPKYESDIIVKDFKVLNENIASTGWSSKKILEEFIQSDFKFVLDSKGQETRFEVTKSGAIEAVKKRKKDKGHFLSVLRGFGTTNQMRIQLSKLNLTFSYPKPVELVKYLINAFTGEGDIVLDSFAGSGTTGHALLTANHQEKTGRKFILIEMSESNAATVIQPRLRHVIDGHEKAEIVATGGGFNYYQLGDVVFNESGALQEGISFQALAAHIWFSITRKSLPTVISENLDSIEKSPLIGVFNGIAIYLLYNGILGDKRPQGGNVLTSKVLAVLPEHPENLNGKKLIFGETSRMGSERLIKENIIFKQIPYDIKGR